MTREEAKIKFDLARSGAFGQYRRNEMLKVIDEIFDVYEADIRAEDENAKALTKERDKYNAIAADLQVSRQKAFDKIEELEARVESMKSCANCEYVFSNTRESPCCSCDSYNKWELRKC